MLLCSGVQRWRCCIGVYALAFLHRPACIGRFCINSQLLPDGAALSSLQGTPASSIFPMALRHSAAILFAMALPASSSAAAPLPAASLSRRPRQQHLPDGAPTRRLGQQETSSAPPASNKPHLAEKSTPVWLAIWHTWAGFANSQLRCAAFCCTYSYICTHPRYCHLEPLLRHSKSFGPSAPIAYATYVSPPDEAVAWPGAGLGCWVWLLLFQVQVFGAGYGCRLAGVEVLGGK